jgi:outer membrane protein assembly factor BamE (lipoprotein component of BamABCDE complex)
MAATHHSVNGDIAKMIRSAPRRRSIARPVLRSASMAAVVMASIALAACQPVVRTHGFMPATDEIAQLRPGEQTREDVRAILGAPSTTGTFETDTWYYIQRRTSTIAFYSADVTEQDVLGLRFGDDGRLADIVRFGLDDGRTISYVDRVTPTSGNELTVLEQFVGNIGRFNSEGSANRPGNPSGMGGRR